MHQFIFNLTVPELFIVDFTLNRKSSVNLWLDWTWNKLAGEILDQQMVSGFLNRSWSRIDSKRRDADGQYDQAMSSESLGFTVRQDRLIHMVCKNRYKTLGSGGKMCHIRKVARAFKEKTPVKGSPYAFRPRVIQPLNRFTQLADASTGRFKGINSMGRNRHSWRGRRMIQLDAVIGWSTHSVEA